MSTTPAPRKPYPTDVGDEEWAFVAPYLTLLSEEALQRLMSYDWPGNVRELEHTIERAVVLARGGIITAENLAMEVDREIAIIDLNQQLTHGKTLSDVVASIEKRYMQRALLRSDGNRHAAAKLLGIDIATLEKKLGEHGLDGRA